MSRTVGLVTMLCVAVAAVAVHGRSNISPAKMAELWSEPTDLAGRNLLHGAGGEEHAPDPNGRYTLVTSESKGFSASYDVKDEGGRAWSVKLGARLVQIDPSGQAGVR